MKKHLLAGFALAIATTLFAISYAVGSLLSAPLQSVINTQPDDLPIEKITLTTDRGNQLFGWFIPGKAGQGAVLLMHGVRSNRLQMINRTRFLHHAGYAVLLFDFQAHGESPGEHITFGFLESQDATTAYYYLQQPFA